MQGVDLPELPGNARYLHHPNECYDWGTFGWVLQTQDIDMKAYKHFIFLNSSVRGPFLPPYLQVRMHAAVAAVAAKLYWAYFFAAPLAAWIIHMNVPSDTQAPPR